MMLSFQSNTEVYLSFASIYINPVYMKHLIKRGLGLICITWVCLSVVAEVGKLRFLIKCVCQGCQNFFTK